MKKLEIKSLQEILGEHSLAKVGYTTESMAGMLLFPSRRFPLAAPEFQAGNKTIEGVEDYVLPDVSIAYIPNAVLTHTGCVIADDKYIVLETLEGEPQDNGLIPVEGGFALPEGTEPLVLDEKMLCFSKFGVFNYCIFLTEILPAAYILSLQGQYAELKYLMKFPHFMSRPAVQVCRDYLQALNYSEERRYDPTAAFTRVKGVYIAKTGNRYRNHRANQLLPMMAGHFKHAFCTTDGHSPRRIYVSRQKAGSRQVKNHEVITPILDKYQVESLALEEYSTTEQINLFAKAELVVAEHGAGLVNAIYMRPGATMVEMFPDQIVGRWAFRAISNVFRQRYLFGSFPVPEGWRFNVDHIHLPPQTLESLLVYATDSTS